MESPQADPGATVHTSARSPAPANPVGDSGDDLFDIFVNTANRASEYAGEERRIAVEGRDDYLVRLGRRATTFGWAQDEGGERKKRWETAVTHDHGDEEGDDTVVEEKAAEKTEKQGDSEQGGQLRRNSSLSVFHDLYELEDNCDTPPLTPGSRIGSHSRLPSLSSSSTTSSPQTRRLSLSPLTPSVTTTTSLPSLPSKQDTNASESEIDNLAESVLALQDRFGLFALLESIIEWPFTATPLHFPEEPSPPPLYSNVLRTSPSSTPALSRSGSFQSMTLSNSLKLSSLGEETGELKRLYRVKSQSDLARRDREKLVETEEKENQSVAGCGAVLVDMLSGLGSFI